ncbi:putative F-box protein At5g52610 [Selaginella moellendorffii]|uniref:putative F-box protein At5g52610 n=1 Tax=Selaginella moellendorffii TaxID=88036 RepID=UPI000D1C271B|nr:putative F-box protein At5g52610 [Selaginella moellendorffii]|eukprot:XP_024539428.1 putative F-box protein At5g52610 [Selaginella moellendorffii]
MEHVDILLKLPGPSLLRARAVCKAWKEVIDSPWFSNRYRDPSPYILLPSPNQEGLPLCNICHLVLGKWFKLEFPSTYIQSVSQSGLVLVREGRVFWVGNPFFNKWKRYSLELPYAKFDHELATLADDEQGYRVVFRVRRFMQTAVLYSWKSEWLVTEERKEDIKMEDFADFVTSSSTVCGNIIHSIGSKNKVALLSCRVDNGKVLSLRYLKLGSEVLEGRFKLFGWDGKLYLLGENDSHLFGLFEIRGENVVLISWAPESISTKFPFVRSASIYNNTIYCIFQVKLAMLVTYNLSKHGVLVDALMDLLEVIKLSWEMVNPLKARPVSRRPAAAHGNKDYGYYYCYSC